MNRQTSKTLMEAARYIEQHGYSEAGMDHPFNAIARVTQPYGLPERSPQRKCYTAAANRVMDCAGLDHCDLTAEEAIDLLVAAACME